MPRRIDDFRPYNAEQIAFFNKGIGITSPNVQSAIEEIYKKMLDSKHRIPYQLSFSIIDNFRTDDWDKRTSTGDYSLTEQGLKVGSSDELGQGRITKNVSFNVDSILAFSFIRGEGVSHIKISLQIDGSWDTYVAMDAEFKTYDYPSDGKPRVYTLNPRALIKVGFDEFNNNSEVTAIRFEVFNKAGQYGDVTFTKLGLLANPLHRGIISLAFDDANVSDYEIAFPKLKQYGYTGTIYAPIKNAINRVSELKEMYDAGWDISVHGWDHDYDYSTPEKIKKEFIDAKNWLIENGFIRGSNHLAYPGGIANEDILSVVRNSFITARGTGGVNNTDSIETLPPANPLHLRKIEGSTARNLDWYKQVIDKVIEGKCWGIFMFHSINETGSGTGAITIDLFEKIIDYLYEAGANVQNVSSVENYIPDPAAYELLK